ncbi:neural cell adhesion molecule 1-like isoform X5 [Biomphalaria glabrata]|uniref:Neural cell adhesion molecule 1-like isoform X5 n=1 Tax=Biomphalaria glabrata TaxID=6526 RepID=A0A9W2YSL5_BIOGL|nr:neural cell adhesion molecule 1-like isoform X5 [Biomphalaria glabrata]
MFSILVFLKYWIVYSAAQQPMVTLTNHDIGDTFNITCDVTRFSDLKVIPNYDYLGGLSVFRQTFLTLTKLQIAIYAPFTPFYQYDNSTFLIQNNPPKQWLFQYSGGNSLTNRNKIQIIVTAVNFQCSDAGEYTCRADLPTGETFFNSPANITVKAPISAHKIKINLHNGNESNLSTNNVKENITLTCTVTGPPNLLIIWKQTAKDSAEEYPATGEVSNYNTSPSIVSTGCAISNYTSELEFELQKTDDGNTYYCIVLNDTGEQSKLNFTIRTFPTQQPMVTLTHHDIGDTFNITCDVTRFADLKVIPNYDYLGGLSVFRQTFLTLTKLQIAIYTPFTPFYDNTTFNIQNNPPKQWLFQYSGGESRTNRNKIQIIVTAVNFQCSDAGEYTCRADLPTGETFFNSPANITVKAPISAHKIKINLHNGNESNLSTNNVEENITLTCTVTGPPSLLIIWKQTAKDSAKEYPATGEVSNYNTLPSIVSTGCAISNYTSELEFELQKTDDGNTYYCIVLNDTGEQSKLNFTIRTFPILPQQPIVTSIQHRVGDIFNMTCDVTKFPGLKVIPNQDYLSGLSLIRKNIQSGYTEIADYKPFSTVKHNNDNLPSQWLVQYIGGENSTNRQSIRIIVTAFDFQCIDAGTYKCKAELPNGDFVFSRPIEITVEAPISDHKIKINRLNRNDSYSSTNYVGENITLTCTVTGPPSLLITWNQTAKGSTKENPATGEISFNSTSESVVSAGCELHHYSSKLDFELQEIDDGNTYYCIVSNDTGEQSRENFTLRIIPTIKSKSQPESQSAGTGVGTVFAGGLASLASATALIYYVGIMKKPKSSQDDKHECGASVSI